MDPSVPTTSVMFVQSTRRGILVNKLKEGEDELARITGFRIKYQEAGGVQLSKIFSTDLARDQPCGRNVCWPCQTSKEGETKNCKARSILYETSCIACGPVKDKTAPVEDSNLEEGDLHVAVPSPCPGGRVGIYLGESSRSLNERASEHMRDAMSFHEKLLIIKHRMDRHSGHEPATSIQVQSIENF